MVVGVSMSSLPGADNPEYIDDENSFGPPYANGQAKSDGIAIISDSAGLQSGVLAPSNGKRLDSVLPDGVLPSGGQNGGPPTPNDSGPGLQKQVSTVEMKRSINLLHCTAIMVAVTGHSSIFVSPSNIIKETGSYGAALIVWLVGGLINLGMALCFAELGTMFPKAGGPYSYTMKSFGPLMGFLIMWGYTVLIAGPFWAFLAYTAALYIVKPAFPNCVLTDQVDTAVKLLAGWIMGKCVTIVVSYI